MAVACPGLAQAWGWAKVADANVPVATRVLGRLSRPCGAALHAGFRQASSLRRPGYRERVQSDMKPSESMLAPINLQRDLAGLRQLAVALVGADDAEDLLQDAACVTLATGARRAVCTVGAASEAPRSHTNLRNKHTIVASEQKGSRSWSICTSRSLPAFAPTRRQTKRWEGPRR